MKITADTNILVRAISGDDAQQSTFAQSELASADVIAVTLPALCELVWIPSRGYPIPTPRIGEAIRCLINSANVVINRPAVETGLALLDAGGYFADGVSAYEGTWLGAEEFVSFDREAVQLLATQGLAAR
jgi:predicted nucleic-acid-binding protein